MLLGISESPPPILSFGNTDSRKLNSMQKTMDGNSGAAVNNDSSKIVTPPVIINQRKTT